MKHTAFRSVFTFITVMLLSIRSLFAEIPNFHFEQIPTLSALPNNEILTLLQDSDGFIWIATKGGLYKYDGYNIKEYRSNLYNPELLSDNWVSALAEDNNKRLYIGTKDGLNILDKQNGNIRQNKDPLFKHNYIACILPVSDSEIWTATNRGLIIYNPSTNKSANAERFARRYLGRDVGQGALPLFVHPAEMD